MFELRKYQQEAVDKGLEYLRGKSEKPAIIVAPTAAGKSLIISKLAQEYGEPCLVLQPSKELLVQNIGKLRDMGGEASIYSASLSTREFGNFTYATLGSIKNLAREFKLLGVKTVILDEVHAGYPPEAGSMFSQFMKELKPKKVIGFTATPFRLKSSMGGSELQMLTRMRPGYFKEYLHVIQIHELVNAGFWAKLKYRLYNFDESSLALNSTGNDFTEESVRKAIKEQGINNSIYKDLKILLEEGRRGILVFMDSLETALKMSEHIPYSAYLGSDTSQKDRDRIISDFKSGKIRVILNFNILSVGFDYPELDTVILGSPTNSLAMYYQRVGRGVRLHKDKDHCLIIDYCNNIKRFGPVETLVIEDFEGWGWGVFNNDVVLTNTPMGGFRITKQQITQKHLDKINGKAEPIKSIKVDLNDENVIWFGKFKGQKLETIPVNYVKFMLEKFDFNTPRMFKLKTKLLTLMQEHESKMPLFNQ